jgi:hypothetical protein
MTPITRLFHPDPEAMQAELVRAGLFLPEQGEFGMHNGWTIQHVHKMFVINEDEEAEPIPIEGCMVNLSPTRHALPLQIDASFVVNPSNPYTIIAGERD